MSLVGSLEDLGLGDILQIVSLSRKSGLLLLRTDESRGRIAFRVGLVHSAWVSGQPEDLRGLLLSAKRISDADYDAALERARAEEVHVEDVLASAHDLGPDAIEALRREGVENAVLAMFRWEVGEFSFEVHDRLDGGDELALRSGVNAQYLTMESARRGDEGAPPEGDFVFSGEEEVPELDPVAPEPAAPDAPAAPDEKEESVSVAAAVVEEIAAELVEENAAAAPVVRETPEPAAPPEPPQPLPLVLIDPDLRALEWTKAALAGLFSRIHIFQHSEGGVARVRQYLARAQTPAVLVSVRAPVDTLAGTGSIGELLRRLRAQAPRMALVALHDGEGQPPGAVGEADGWVVRPTRAQIEAGGVPLEQAAARLRSEIARQVPVPAPPEPPAAAPGPAPAQAQDGDVRLHRLKQVSERLRDPAARGEVLVRVLEFAAESFQRVAIFMIRDDVALGLAQRGLPGAGGPDDGGFRSLRVPLSESTWLTRLLDSGEPQTVSGEVDRPLVARLGEIAPREAYLAPIESGGRVAAVLYADNLPDDDPLPETTALAIVLHEAGLSLDRVLLERALAELEGGSTG